MKTTSKASLLKSQSGIRVRPVALIQEKLARSRLLLQVEDCHRLLLDAVNLVLNPIVRQGHHALSQIALSECSQPIEPDLNHAWFILSYHRTPLAWWRIDRCTLDQLASGYYGSSVSPLSSPLRSPSQSEFRLAKKLILAALSALPTTELDEDALQLELVSSTSPLDASVQWEMSFPTEQLASPLLFCMTENLLGLMAKQPSQYQADPELAERLSHRLRQIPLKVSLELGRQSIPVTSIDTLKIGDVLPINLHSRCPVTVGKRPLFYASVHTHEGQMVAKLTHDAYQQEDPHNG